MTLTDELTPSNDFRFLSIELLKIFSLVGIITSSLDLSYINTDKILHVYWVAPAFTLLITIYSFQLARHFIDQDIWSWYSPVFFKKLVLNILPPYLLLIFFQIFSNSLILGVPIKTTLYTILTEGAIGRNAYYLFILFQLLYVFPFYLLLAKYYPMSGFAALIIFAVVYPLWPADKLTTLLYNNLFLRFSIQLFLGSALAFHWKTIKKSALPIFAFLFGFFYFVLQDLDYDFHLFNRAHDLESSLFPGLFIFSIIFFMLSRENFFQKFSLNVKRFVVLLGDSIYHILIFQLYYFSFLRQPVNLAFINSLQNIHSHRVQFLIEFVFAVTICFSGGLITYYFHKIAFRISRFYFSIVF